MHFLSKTIKRFIFIAAAVSALIALPAQKPAQAQNQAAPKVIPIGDSVTEDFGGGGWRGPLNAKLAAVGQSITYVGTRADSAGNHEAYGGAASCDFFTDRRSFMADTYGKAATWDIRTSLAATSPNVAIIDVGINNYIDNYSLQQGLASTVPCGLNRGSLERLWDAVVYYPGITGVVITTVEDAALPDGTDNVNAIVRKYVADRTAQGKNVCLGELPASFAGLTMPGDRYQLSAAGKDVVAAALVTPTLTAIAGSCATGTITTGTVTVPLFGFSTSGASAFTSAMAALNPPGFLQNTTGVMFKMTATQTAAAIRFWKVVGDTATTRTVGLYSSGGVLLASGTSIDEPSSGWVSVPIQATALNSGSTYVAAMFSPAGAFAYQYQFFAAPISSSSAVASANAGVYVYGPAMMFPTNFYLASGYFIDVDIQQ